MMIPPGIETVETYYFGCWEQSGHFWRSKSGYDEERRIETRVPAPLRRGHIDGNFCPGAVAGSQWKKTRAEVEGEAALHHIDGWTVLAWWDRSVDRRGACNSAIAACGLFDFATMLAITRAQFPTVLTRRKDPPVLVVDMTGAAPLSPAAAKGGAR